MFVIHAQFVKLFTFIRHSILFQCFFHVQVSSIVFPCIAGCMCIVFDIAILDFTQYFLRANLEGITIMLKNNNIFLPGTLKISSAVLLPVTKQPSSTYTHKSSQHHSTFHIYSILTSIGSTPNSATTSFPGSLFSASFSCWNRDPGCGWSRDHPSIQNHRVGGYSSTFGRE